MTSSSLFAPSPSPDLDTTIKSEPDTAPQICSEYWFNDGNIVLVAGSSLFKVHRGQLERHSEVFRDLFSIPQPKVQDSVHGAACIQLYDNPSDVFYLLKALYDGMYFKQPYSTEFPFLAAVLRLSTKYLIYNLRECCLARIAHDFPTTLEGWDLREKAVTDMNGRYGPRERIPSPILLINLARELDLMEILPAAFYDLSRYGTSKTVLGTPTPAVEFKVLETQEAPTVFLAHNDLVDTFRGREAAQRSVASFISKELSDRPISASCAHRNDEHGKLCRESFYFILLNTLRSAIDMLHRTDFSDGERMCGLRMCCFCKLDFAGAVKRAREQIWREIPGWFGMEGFEKMSRSPADVQGDMSACAPDVQMGS
ncbi:hypothetical protein EVG20_g1589 [Dentipellis fragilis]|uniref:BTB domain-containing protein n=1 Tax=Dentipellis fragilis TaxID=205917 RepID=A0A4Y9ZC75_9AGAM|nr:hypothetical protein EVG20_g1589 [Dentipellis fragilis]